MSSNKDYEKVYVASLVLALLLLGANVYCFCRPVLAGWHATSDALDYVVGRFRSAGAFRSPVPTKAAVAILLVLSTIVRSGKGRKFSWWFLGPLTAVSLLLFFIPYITPSIYLFTTILGASGILVSSSFISRLYGGLTPHDNDLLESFDQQTERLGGAWTINIPMEFYWRKRWHDGWINVVNPFRGTMVMGLPGSGKSFSVFIPYISQLIAKGFTMMLYDYKMPDLSLTVYNELLKNTCRYPKPPQFYCINFKDPQRSNRCNPIAARYMTDIVDASETARVLMAALSRGDEKKDFFTNSAQQYAGIAIWKLARYTPHGGRQGEWCDIPHLIELINQDYEKVLNIIRRDTELSGKAKVFIDAMDAGAQNQLQGQIASVRIPLNDIASPILYWVLSGDDFTLEINDPEAPKIVCIGNDPDRQEVYGLANSLFTFRTIKLVNRKGMLPCALVLDELPTVRVEGLDGLMATARSNKVAVTLGIQDISQLIADYGEKTAEKILSLPANMFIGQVNGKTAERYSKEFGKEFRRQEGQTVNLDSESLNISYHEEEVMPVRKIATLPSGTFIGKVAVDNDTVMKQNFFCARVKASPQGKLEPLPILTDFHLETVRKDLENPYIREARLRAWIGDMLVSEGGTDEADLYDEVDRRLRMMPEAKKKEILEQMVPIMEQEKIRSVIEENYVRIRVDIQRMIDEEYVPTDEEVYS